MSPMQTAVPEKSGEPPAPTQPAADIDRLMAKEVVVDWQLCSDLERKN